MNLFNHPNLHGSKATLRDSRRPLMAYRLLFPLAALYALAIVPVWIEFGISHPIGIDTTWHGHEMLFGFALAVIAGFLSTRPLRGVA